MGTLVRERGKITAKGQTTMPEAVRQALGVSYGCEIAYVVDEHGVRLSRVETEEETDPVIEGFLVFLVRDMAQRPQAIAAFPAGGWSGCPRSPRGSTSIPTQRSTVPWRSDP